MTRATDAPNSLSARVSQAVQTLTPGYFRLTMASGIISVGLQLEGFHALSVALLVVCGLSFAVVLVLSLVRLVRLPADMRARTSRTRAGRSASSPSLPERTCWPADWNGGVAD